MSYLWIFLSLQCLTSTADMTIALYKGFGDIILKVSQENNEPIDVVSMPLDNAIKLIKGPAKSYVTLTVKKIDGYIKDVRIMRDLVELEEVYAKSTLINKEKSFSFFLWGIVIANKTPAIVA